MTDITYDIVTASGTYVAKFNTEGPHGITRGESTSFEFYFPQGNDELRVSFDELVVSGTYTIQSGESETHPLVTVESGATLTVEGTLETSDIVVNGTLTGDGQLNVFDGLNEMVIDGIEFYDTVIIANRNTLTVTGELYAREITNNGILNNDGGVVTLQDAFSDLRDYEQFAGKYVLSETLNSTQRYKERLPTTAPISSLLVGIQPAQELQDRDLPAIWGLINNVDDSRPQPLTVNRLVLDVDVLATTDDYSDFETTAQNLEI